MMLDWGVTAAGLQTLVVKRFLGNFRMRAAELSASQWYDSARLLEYQRRRLGAVLQDCVQNVSYYQGLFHAMGLDVRDFSSPDAITRLPIMEKEAVTAAGRDLVSKKFPKWMMRVAHTGGTTGRPLHLYRNIFSIGDEYAFVQRQYAWAGIEFGDRCAYLTGRIVVPADQVSGRLYRYDSIQKQLILSTYHLSAAVSKQYVDAMIEHKVVALVAYPSSAYTLARECLERGLKIRLRAVLTSSETMQPDVAETIREAFGCPVYDFYGSAERVCYIHMCEFGAYHIVQEYGITELIPSDSVEGACEVVATGFWNPAMPLLRYRLGDLVIPGDQSCSCGRSYPTVKKIIGRPIDFLVTPSGRRLGAALLTHLLYGAKNVLESQLVQDSPESVEVRFVPSDEFSGEDLAELRRLAAMHLPKELHVRFERVSRIERTVSGKFRPIVSLLN